MFLALTSESIPIFRSGTQIRLSDQNSQNPYPFSNQKAIPLGVADVFIVYTGGYHLPPPPGPLGFKCPYFKSSISPTDLLIERNREVGGRL